MRAFFLNALLVLLAFEISLAVPNGLYLAMVFLVGLNFFIKREYSYKLAFALGIMFDLANVHLFFISSTLALILLVKLAEIFAERVYNSESEYKTYLLTVLGLTLLLALPNLVLNASWFSLWILAKYLVTNGIAVFLCLFVFRKFREIYYLN